MSRKKGDHGVRRRYEYIKANQHKYNIRMMCRLLGVARSGYYDWLKKPESDRAIEDKRLLRLIRASFAASQGVYGAPRVFLDLREAGETCSKHRVARLMRENNIRAQPGYRTRRYVAGKPAELIPDLVKRNSVVEMNFDSDSRGLLDAPGTAIVALLLLVAGCLVADMLTTAPISEVMPESLVVFLSAVASVALLYLMFCCSRHVIRSGHSTLGKVILIALLFSTHVFGFSLYYFLVMRRTR